MYRSYGLVDALDVLVRAAGDVSDCNVSDRDVSGCDTSDCDASDSSSNDLLDSLVELVLWELKRELEPNQ